MVHPFTGRGTGEGEATKPGMSWSFLKCLKHPFIQQQIRCVCKVFFNFFCWVFFFQCTRKVIKHNLFRRTKIYWRWWRAILQNSLERSRMVWSLCIHRSLQRSLAHYCVGSIQLDLCPEAPPPLLFSITILHGFFWLITISTAQALLSIALT